MSRSSSQAIILIEELIEENNDLKDKNKQLDQLAKQKKCSENSGNTSVGPPNSDLLCLPRKNGASWMYEYMKWNEMNVMNTESWNPEYWTSPDQG